jgi:hypothetical protein
LQGRKDWFDHLARRAATSQPSLADTEEVFTDVARDPFWQVRIRTMDVLPHLADRERVVDVLIACTRERDPLVTGNGLIPFYATHYLAQMHAYRAIPDIAAWVNYLRTNQVYGASNAHMLEVGERTLAAMQAATRPAN